MIGKVIIACAVFLIPACASSQQKVSFSTDLNDIYKSAEKIIESSSSHNKPLIAVSSNIDGTTDGVGMTYINAVIKAGGIPVILPELQQPEVMDALLDRVDALLLTGGQDIHPLIYGSTPINQLGTVRPDRDVADLVYFRLALKRHMPILGICRGEQLINVAMGGTMFQDLPSERPESNVMHRQSGLMPGSVPAHSITVDKSSRLYKILGIDNLQVNSFHHQAVKDVAKGLKVGAYSSDGVVESIESEQYNILGVQFHPEKAYQQDENCLKIIADLIERAKAYRK